jgi:hypothetical protein
MLFLHPADDGGGVGAYRCHAQVFALGPAYNSLYKLLAHALSLQRAVYLCMFYYYFLIAGPVVDDLSEAIGRMESASVLAVFMLYFQAEYIYCFTLVNNRAVFRCAVARVFCRNLQQQYSNMKKIVILLAVVILSPMFIAGSCNKNCGGDVVCTDQLVMVTLQVTDPAGVPIVLDEAYTTRKSTGEVIRLTQSMEGGYYIVLDDTYQKKLQNAVDEFQFTGIRAGQKIVDEKYTISADCCHIAKQSGRDAVQL